MAYNKKYNEYKENYSRINYDRIQLVTPKGTKEKLSTIAAEKGISVNGLINTLISELIEHYEKDGGNKSDPTAE